jgi:hypothetical protein
MRDRIWLRWPFKKNRGCPGTLTSGTTSNGQEEVQDGCYHQWVLYFLFTFTIATIISGTYLGSVVEKISTSPPRVSPPLHPPLQQKATLCSLQPGTMNEAFILALFLRVL